MSEWNSNQRSARARVISLMDSCFPLCRRAGLNNFDSVCLDVCHPSTARPFQSVYINEYITLHTYLLVYMVNCDMRMLDPVWVYRNICKFMLIWNLSDAARIRRGILNLKIEIKRGIFFFFITPTYCKMLLITKPSSLFAIELLNNQLLCKTNDWRQN